MNSEKIVNLEWDYFGYNKYDKDFWGEQEDWNQTFITKINQINATIFKKYSDEQNDEIYDKKIIINDKTLKMFKTLLYFNENKMTLINDRYGVILDNNISDNTVYVEFGAYHGEITIQGY